MRYLILGGTGFVGRAIAEAAFERGHTVSVFNRGVSDPEGLAFADNLKGDRAGDLAVLEEGSWDRVVDCSGYVPRHVAAAANLLAERARHYTFISTQSVYADYGRRGPLDEEADLATLEEDTEEVTGDTYGALKALCERVVDESFEGRSMHVRAGVIVGPGDPTDRFTYWPARFARGGEVLAPGNPSRLVQVIDVRDLADWVVYATDRGRTGAYNAGGPEYRLTFRRLLERCRTVLDADVTITWVPDDFLLPRGVGQWRELPLWLAAGEDATGDMHADNSLAIAEGLVYRPLAETIADTLTWDRARGEGDRKAGMDAATEARLLEAWRSSAGL